MDKHYSQLPNVPIQPPPKVDWFSRRYLLGYLFVALSFLAVVLLIYQLQNKPTPQETRICVQVITPARNQVTGEVRDFPTPCDVPEGWVELQTQILPQ